MKKDKVVAIIAAGIIFLVIMVIGGGFSFLAYENYNTGINLPVSFLATYVRVIFSIIFLTLVALAIYCHMREIKHFLSCKGAKISRRWNHFLRRNSLRKA